jgi:hypothetical protein
MKKQRSASPGTSFERNCDCEIGVKSVSDTDFYNQPAFLKRVKRKLSIATMMPTAKG